MKLGLEAPGLESLGLKKVFRF